jgi:hypothetical protein|tara:strand:+ start:201 stop:308 length:108 start_codon:yes stop_codon:yes gene_type:complete
MAEVVEQVIQTMALAMALVETVEALMVDLELEEKA